MIVRGLFSVSKLDAHNLLENSGAQERRQYSPRARHSLSSADKLYTRDWLGLGCRLHLRLARTRMRLSRLRAELNRRTLNPSSSHRSSCAPELSRGCRIHHRMESAMHPAVCRGRHCGSSNSHRPAKRRYPSREEAPRRRSLAQGTRWAAAAPLQ